MRILAKSPYIKPVSMIKPQVPKINKKKLARQSAQKMRKSQENMDKDLKNIAKNSFRVFLIFVNKPTCIAS